MPTTPLLLRAPSARIWERFHAGKPLRREDPGLETLVLRWRRAKALRTDRTGTRSGGGGPLDAHELAHRRGLLDELWSSGASCLTETAEELARGDRLLLVTDPNGVLVRSFGGGRYLRDAEALGLCEGARWSEAVRGTNAIGTSLLEERPVAVEGFAHFDRAYHRLAAYACPLYGSGGALCGALAIASSIRAPDPSLHALAIATVRTLEQLLREHRELARNHFEMKQLETVVLRCPSPALLLDRQDGLRVVNDAARRLLGLPSSRITSLPLRELLGIGWKELQSNAAHPEVEAVIQLPDHASRYGGGPALARLRVEPILDRKGEEPRALLAFVDPRRPRAVPGPRSSSSPARPSEVSPDDPFAPIFGRDPKLLAALDAAESFAPTTLPVLLLAETGTGKDLLARAIHRASPRADRPFVPINCGALSPQLLESELFGYEPAAFTGASRAGREGKIASADGGTLFLDEVAEMPPPLQAALLRVLEDGTYYRVGGNESRQADVRLICATCRDLAALVEDGNFRRDLYYRIKGACLLLPPLRERNDVEGLALFLLHQLTEELFPGTRPRVAPEVLEWIRENPWPGNVRELRTALHHAVILARGEIRMEHLPADLLPSFSPRPSLPAPRPASPTRSPRPLREVESATLRRALDAADGNISRAAKELGIARSTLYRKIRRYGLEPSS